MNAVPPCQTACDPAVKAAALDSVDDAITITTADGHIVYANDSWYRLTGFSLEQVLGVDCMTLVSPLTTSKDVAVIAETLRAGRAWHGEMWCLRASGEPYLARCTTSPVRGRDGRTTNLVTIQRDISAFRRAAEKQRAWEASFHALTDHLPIGIAVQRDGRFVYVNPSLVQSLGYTDQAELLTRPVLDLVVPDQRDAVAAALAAAGDGREPLSQEWRLVRVTGAVMLAEVSLIPSFFDGGPAVLGTVGDLTERRQLETRLLESDRMVAIGTLAAGIAHEINTPIQFVGDSAHFLGGALGDLIAMLGRYRAFAERVREGLPAEVAALKEGEAALDVPYIEESAPAAVTRVLDGVERVATIVRAMKEFGHPGGDAPTSTDLNRALEATLVVARNEIKYVADVEQDLGELPPVICRVNGLNQVFLNLLVNAAHAVGDVMKATGARGRITVRSRLEGDHVHISIADTGTGIPEAIRSRVFDPFFTTKEVGKGTGQGLAIARSIIVDKHGGRIHFDSELGKGTTFHVHLPVHGRAEPS
ncbi:MAG: PAS domain S-box protein [Deltaproteobacteria bacterium]|nr:PAS domain S-box protein [Deltaproteobacteria bacterium]